MKSYHCPKCQQQHLLDELTEFVACTHCFAYLKVEGGALNAIPAFRQNRRPTDVCFEVGQMLSINGAEYSIKGMTQRNDAEQQSTNWREYCLETPSREVAFLNEYNGNWLLVKPLTDFVSNTQDHTIYRDDVPYLLFQRYFQEVNWASGYFDFDITDIKRLYSKEYIAPPKMLISESYKTDIEKNTEWYEGEYVSYKDIYQQFLNLGNTNQWPTKIGIGPTEPHKTKINFKDAASISLIAMLVVLFVQLFFLITTPTKTVFTDTFSLYDLAYDSLKTYSSSAKPLISKSFTIDKTSKLKIELSSSMDNSWLESNITMINEANKDELPIVISNEFYRGVENGESWTEGTNRANLDYSSVPAGKYHLLIETSSSKHDGSSYSISLKSGGVYWVNIFILLALMACLPVYLYIVKSNFESSRWFDSDFAPNYE